jgi:superfamily II DNA or RNA helicase
VAVSGDAGVVGVGADVSANLEDQPLNVAPGSVVVVRDEEWLVTGVEHTRDGALLTVQGLSELVRETTATFYERYDDIAVHDPAQATVLADPSPGYRRARLWLEATLRKTAVPLDVAELTVSTRMLATALDYQQAAVRRALDPANLRPRVLLADAVGLGKTLEIGMILAELARRGRGERVLIVSPRHVLEQMQHELWCRFALPFVRLDSVGIQRVRQKLPATRNPFAYFKRAIISIDTLKSEKYLAYLRRQHWDAIVIDESHNVTNSSTQNNRLARVLAPTTDALILASATPHNGRAESFAELVRLLEPTAVGPDGTLPEDEVGRLVVRRHRNSPEVARTVGADWAERKEPQNFLVPASPEENAVARELDEVWLHPASGRSPYSGQASRLFPWTLAKAFLSSPAALRDTVAERLRRLGPATTPQQRQEVATLRRLQGLNEAALAAPSAKYGRLRDYLRGIGVGAREPMRAVVFAERIPTLTWLRGRLLADFGFAADQVRMLHGGLSDTEQQELVESFKLASSPIRVLVTGDVASEGVNLHLQCHELIHFDVPWSLIRIEQRNGRIDRYGQRHRPQITTLLLEPDAGQFSGDLRVLTRLLEKERQAHTALGDVASLMGKYDVDAEEEEIRKVLAGEQRLEAVIGEPDEAVAKDPIAAMLARIAALPAQGPAQAPDGGGGPLGDGGPGAGGGKPAGDGAGPVPRAPVSATDAAVLFDSDVSFLREALHEVFETPGAEVSSRGVRWREYPAQQIVEFTPPEDLRSRLEVLPQSYLAERRITETFKLATTPARGAALLEAARGEGSDSTWPEAHYLGPLHPVLDWAADRALGQLGRNQVFAVRGAVAEPTVLLVGTLTNRRGQVVASAAVKVAFPNPGNLGFAMAETFDTAAELVRDVGLVGELSNPGPPELADLPPYVAAAVQRATAVMAQVFAAATENAQARVQAWSARVSGWEAAADDLAQRLDLKQRRVNVEQERAMAAGMAPDRQLVRPLVLVLPADHPVGSGVGPGGAVPAPGPGEGAR